jgi:hypothetical protein
MLVLAKCTVFGADGGGTSRGTTRNIARERDEVECRWVVVGNGITRDYAADRGWRSHLLSESLEDGLSDIHGSSLS